MVREFLKEGSTCKIIKAGNMKDMIRSQCVIQVNQYTEYVSRGLFLADD